MVNEEFTQFYKAIINREHILISEGKRSINAN